MSARAILERSRLGIRSKQQIPSLAILERSRLGIRSKQQIPSLAFDCAAANESRSAQIERLSTGWLGFNR